MTERKRVRTKVCCIDGCSSTVWRSESFGVCTDHLLRIWRQIDRERIRLGAYDISIHNLPNDDDAIAGPAVTKAAERAHAIKARPPHAQEGTIYVLDTGVHDGVKIGWTSRDVYRRLAEYPPTFRVIVTAPGTRADERDLHRSLKLFRMDGMGKEWYHADNGEVVRAINDLIARSNMKQQQRAGREAERDVERAEQQMTGWIATQRHGMTRKIESLAAWRADQPRTTSTAAMPGPRIRSSKGRAVR